ncbi:hypothetical protein I0P11_18555 [Acinetobacter baumannii]|uniref:hypothetical protein n=1 Tax=Acinetobacter baumannii TaxID=470 RepID=UPI0018B00234|nr:hypothetical protein [Acinetobacter baumannii]MBF9263072.1 hypothetical protein [Acinetobacter baumannii]
MNPLALVGMAALGLLAVFIFLGANERSTRNIEINQQKHELESAEFDRDFAKFLNNEKLEAPSDADISAKKHEIKELEAKKKLADAENEKRMAEMQKSLDQMSGYEKEEK